MRLFDIFHKIGGRHAAVTIGCAACVPLFPYSVKGQAVSATPDLSAVHTPADCATATASWRAARIDAYKAEHGGSITIEQSRAIFAQAASARRSCLDRFPIDRATSAQLLELGHEYSEVGVDSLARRALNRRLALTNLAPADRAETLEELVEIAVLGDIPDYGEATRAMLALSDLGEPAATSRMMAYRRLMRRSLQADGTDAARLMGAMAIIDQERALPAGKRTVTIAVDAAYGALVELTAGYGHPELASDIVRRADRVYKGAKDEFSILPRLHGMLSKLDQYVRLVGRQVPQIEAQHWLNAPAGTSTLPRTDQVTLIEFTAHWCSPCADAYPKVVALQRRFGDSLRTVLVTQTWGSFEGKDLPAAEEIAAAKSYYLEKHGLKMPIAIYEQPAGAPSDKAERMGPNERRFGVRAYPTFVVVDRKGVVRLVGNDDRLASDIPAMVEQLVRGGGG